MRSTGTPLGSARTVALPSGGESKEDSSLDDELSNAWAQGSQLCVWRIDRADVAAQTYPMWTNRVPTSAP
jgi:hypothetical protein